MNAPEIIGQLRPLIDWNSFAASLVAQWDRHGRLSYNQMTAAEKMLAKMAANKTTREKVGSVDLSRVHEMFAAALSNGMKEPRFRFGNVRLSYWPVTPEAVYVKLDGEKVGRVVGGRYLPKNITPEAATALTARLLACAADPLAAAVSYGRETGQCACCGRTLTDPESVARGIGPICAARWGLL